MSNELLNGKYVLKPWDVLVHEFGKDEDGNIGTKYGYYYTPEMEKQVPESRIIDVVDSVWTATTYTSYVITPDMLLGPFFKYGEDCEVSDDGENWISKKFICYAPGAVYIVATGDSQYKHVRRPTKKETVESLSDVLDNNHFWKPANESPDYFTQLIFYTEQKDKYISVRIKTFPKGIEWADFKNIYERFDCMKIIAWAYLRDLPNVPKNINE